MYILDKLGNSRTANAKNFLAIFCHKERITKHTSVIFSIAENRSFQLASHRPLRTLSGSNVVTFSSTASSCLVITPLLSVFMVHQTMCTTSMTTYLRLLFWRSSLGSHITRGHRILTKACISVHTLRHDVTNEHTSMFHVYANDRYFYCSVKFSSGYRKRNHRNDQQTEK